MNRMRMAALITALLFVVGCSAGSGGANGSANEHERDSGSSESPSERVVIRGLSAWVDDWVGNVFFQLFIDHVDSISDGQVQIDWVGGPESIPPLEQGEAVRDGAIDLIFSHPAYYLEAFPEGTIWDISPLRLEEIRRVGAFDVINEMHQEKMNAIVLGASQGSAYSLYMMEPVRRIEEFQGRRIRSSPSYLPFMHDLGMETVIMPHAEIFTALERGVVQGAVFPDQGIIDLGMHEIIRYKIEPSFWEERSWVVMNLDSWNALTPQVQEILHQAALAAEQDVLVERARLGEEENRILQEEYGMQYITLEDADAFLEQGVRSGFNYVREELPSEVADRLIEVFSP